MSAPDGARRDAGPRRRSFWLVLALATAVRLAAGLWRGESLMFAGNGLYYMDWLADSLAAGRGYTIEGVPNVFQQPAYVFALAAGYVLFGAGWQAVLAVNTVIGVALVAVTMSLAARVDPRAVIPAGLLAAVHPVLVWHGSSVADTTLFAVTLIGWAHATLWAMQGGRWRAATAAGLWLGLAFLSRPSLAPLVPVGVVAVGWSRRSWRELTTYCVLSMTLAGALTLPWMVRNHGLTGSFPLIGTHGPESVWAANNPEAPRLTEMDSSYDFISEHNEGTLLDVTVFQYALDPVTAVEREALFRDTAAAWMRENPDLVVAMSVVRLGRLWDPRYHPMRWGEVVVPGAMRKDFVHRVAHAGLLLLALVGVALLWARRERRREAAFLLAVLLTYSLSHSLGAGYSRVRFPLDPVLTVFAAFGASDIARRRRRLRQSTR